MSKHMMTAQEAADYLFVSYDTILRWAREGRIPSSRPGHRVLFCKESLDKWLTEQESQRYQNSSKPEEKQYGKIRKIIAG